MAEDNNKMEQIYIQRYDGLQFDEIPAKIDCIKDKEEQDKMRVLFCNELLYAITSDYTKYDSSIDFHNNPAITLFKNNVRKLPKDKHFYWAMYYFYCNNNEKCLAELQAFMEKSYEEWRKDNNSDVPFLNEASLIDCYVEPYKNAFSGFWQRIADMLKKYPVDDGIVELCELIDRFYDYSSEEDIRNDLLTFSMKYPQFIYPQELIAYSYYSDKMWRNAIGYFEKIQDDAMLFSYAKIYWMLAWSYSKCRDYVQEEFYYRKYMEIFPDGEFVVNNLGYCLYKQKKYLEAKELFESCLEKGADLPYAANNYVRVLIALGRNKDAKDFVKKGDFKISKDIVERVKKLDNTNARLKKADEVPYDLDDTDSVEDIKVDLGVKRQQFTSERILEDELTARLESGMPVFGMNLHIYNRKGDYYGRQYPFPFGRLDLLCEDKEGNLYIIELKKDSGYDDAYKQTSDYLDWFQNADISKGKKVYGIICLNSPSNELIEKVHADSRMKLFEYQISYHEI